MSDIGDGKEYNLSEAAASFGLMLLTSRPHHMPLADHMLDELAGKWYQVRRILGKRIMLGDRRQEMPNPETLINALSDLHNFALGAMWAYMCSQGSVKVVGDEAAMAKLRRWLSDGPIS